MLRGRVQGGRAALGPLSVAAPDGATDGQAVEAYVRPHDVKLSPAEPPSPDDGAPRGGKVAQAARIGVIDRGRLVQVGTPRQIYEEPVNAYVATRLGSPGINLLARSLFPDAAAPAATAVIGARSEHTRIRKARNGSGIGKVTWIEHLGDRNHLHVAVEDGELVTLADPDSALAVGDPVSVELVRPLFFDRAGNRVAH